jgi:hypothetical protein
MAPWGWRFAPGTSDLKLDDLGRSPRLDKGQFVKETPGRRVTNAFALFQSTSAYNLMMPLHYFKAY